VIPYIARRLTQAVPVVLVVVVIAFFLIHAAPGDPVLLLSGQHSPSPQYAAEIRRTYGLDQPLAVQLVHYLGRVAQGDLGQSISFSQPVLAVVASRLPPTLLLITTATLFSVIAGIALGTVAGYRPYSLIDGVLSAGSVVAWSLPIFWLAQLLMLLFAVWLEWFPTGGFMSLREQYEGFRWGLDVARHLFLPALTIFLLRLAITGRLARTSTVEVLRENYIRTARAKGLSEGRVLAVHTLKNAVRPVVTATGTGFGTLIAGTVLTETVFSYPGLGRLTYDAILARDHPLLLGLFIAMSLFIVAVNLVTDVVYGVIDPRTRTA
jgi:ABC-type dipeptide/oligopeptide/nickel transport system permease component